VGFMMLLRLCKPLNKLRIALLIAMIIGFTVGIMLFSGVIPILPDTFVPLTPLQGGNILWTIAVCAASVPLFLLLTALMRKQR